MQKTAWNQWFLIRSSTVGRFPRGALKIQANFVFRGALAVDESGFHPLISGASKSDSFMTMPGPEN